MTFGKRDRTQTPNQDRWFKASMARTTQILAIFAMAAVAAIAVVVFMGVGEEASSSTVLMQRLEEKSVMMQKLDEDDSDDQGAKHCGAQCMAKRRRIAAQMKALQKQINGDYKSMITFGHKAGYLPPVKSIKEQVMDGSLLGGSSSDEDAPPTSFDPDVSSLSSSSHSSHSSHSAFGASREKELLKSEEPHHHARSRDDHGEVQRSERQHGNIDARLRDVEDHSSRESHAEVPRHGREVKFHSDSDSDGAKHVESAKWKKLFSFMDRKPHDEAKREVKAPRTRIPSAVRRAIQRVRVPTVLLVSGTCLFVLACV